MVVDEPEMGPQALGVFITRKFFRADHKPVQRPVSFNIASGVPADGRKILRRQRSQGFYDQDPIVMVHFMLNHRGNLITGWFTLTYLSPATLSTGRRFAGSVWTYPELTLRA